MTVKIGRLVYFAVFLTLFVGSNVMSKFGYKIGEQSAPAFQKVAPQVYVIVFLVFLLVLKNRFKIPKYLTQDFYALFFFILLLFYMVFRGIADSISFIPNTLILAVGFSIMLTKVSSRSLDSMRKLVLFFFLINCFIAIVERVYAIHFFEPLKENIDYSGFRSTALQNHPLNNALITSVILVFILTSEVKMTYKVFCLLIGLISIICYGSRSSLAGMILVISVFIVQHVIFSKKSGSLLGKLIFIVLFSLGCFFIFIVATESIFGERIMNRFYFDDSAQTRLQLFGMFELVSMENLLFGMSQATSNYIKDRADVYEIENFWIVWIFRFGAIISSVLIFLFIKFVVRLLKKYSVTNRNLILFCFFLISSTNNSLSTITPALAIYVICAYVFAPRENGLSREKINLENSALEDEKEGATNTKLRVGYPKIID